MKLLVAIALALVAPAQVAAVDPCDYAELPVQLGDLVEPAFKCQTASGYSFVTPSTLPTDAELAKICAKCADFITAALAPGTKLPACQLVLDSGSAVTVSNFFQGIASQCASNTSSANPAVVSSSSLASAPASAGVIPVIPIVTTPPSNESPATTKPSSTGSAPKSQSTSTPSKSPSKSTSEDTDESTDSDDTNSDRSEARGETAESKPDDDDSTPGNTDSTPKNSDTDAQDDLPTAGGSTSKSKTASPNTAALTKTSHAIGVAHAGVTAVAVALLATSAVALRV